MRENMNVRVLLILGILHRGDSYGYELAKTIRARSGRQIEATWGRVYPDLARMVRLGWLKARYVSSGPVQNRIYYTITPDGNRAYLQMLSEWDQYVAAVQQVLSNKQKG